MNVPSVSSLIADEVRKQILDGIYVSGDRLNVDEIARQLNASKTPTREALGRLESEGLVAFRPRYGWNVVSLAIPEFLEYLELQGALRNFIVDDIPLYLDRLNFDLLDQINNELIGFYEQGDYLLFIKQNDLFHMNIFDAHPNTVIRRRLAEVDGLIRLQRVKFFKEEKEFAPVVSNAFVQHKEIIVALREGNPDTVRSVLKKHHQLLLSAYRKMADREVGMG